MASSTILIAEDVPVDGLVLRNILAHAGYHTLLASHGREALEVLEAHPEVSLVLADVGMPEMGGVELVQAMRDRDEWTDLPVLFISGAADAATVRAAASTRPSGYLLKPVTEPSRVLERIEAALDGSEPVLADPHAVFQGGGLGGGAYRDACRRLAQGLREALEGRDGSASPSLPREVASLAASVGARRLQRAWEGPGRPGVRDLQATLNVLTAAGF